MGKLKLGRAYPVNFNYTAIFVKPSDVATSGVRQLKEFIIAKGQYSLFLTESRYIWPLKYCLALPCWYVATVTGRTVFPA